MRVQKPSLPSPPTKGLAAPWCPSMAGTNGPASGITVPQVATVTCPPNADVAEIHHRMGVLLTQEDIPLWLEGSPEEVAELMVPWPEGLLRIRKADNVDWEAR